MFERSYLENIIRNAPIGIITTDLACRVTFVSELAREECQIKGANVSIEQFVVDPGAMRSQLASVILGTEQRVVFEAQVAAPAGRRVIEFTATLLRDDAYVAIGLLLMCEDVTDKRETERKYSTLMANSRDGVVIFKGEQILEVNEAFARAVGRSIESCKGMPWRDFVHPDSLPMVHDFIQRCSSGDETVPHTYDIIGLGTNGARRLYNATVSPLFADRGVYSMVLRDITERKLLEERIAEAKNLESLGLLAGGIAHDFNNLLSGVMGYASLLKTKLDPESAQYRYADNIEASSTHAKELTAQLLAFARGGQYELRQLNLNQLVIEAVRMLRLTMPRTVKLTTRLTSRLSWVEADSTQMHQVVTNLFTNAVEAMPSGGRITIRTENVKLDGDVAARPAALAPGLYVHLSLSDTGKGIAADVLSKVFEPFYSTKGVGHGLGLSAVYGIIHNHRGAVTIESQAGQGTTVHIYLPAARAAEQPREHRHEAIATGQETILVVDDEAIIRDLLGRILDDLGYTVMVASDGDEAVRLYREHHDDIDAVILDMVLPTINGDEVYAAMRQVNADVRVVLCTGYSLTQAVEEMLEQGVSGVLRKPFQIEELSAMLRQALDRPLPSAPNP